jgi:Beta-propeller repeat
MEFNLWRMILGGLLGLSLIACSSTPLDTSTLEEANPINLETGDPVETELELAAAGPWTGEKPIFNDLALTEIGKDITTDNQGNVIATGDVIGNVYGCCDYDPSIKRLLLAKLDPSGAKLWQITRAYPATFASSYQVASDGNRNIYVVGGSTANIDGQKVNGLQDAFISKFSANGTVIWTRMIGTIKGDDGATGVGVDSSNNVYVTGYTCGQNQTLAGKTIRGACDMFVTKFNSGGARQWLQLIGTDNLEIAGGLAVGANGTLAIAGTTNGNFSPGAFNGEQTGFVAKLDSNGNTQWLRSFGGSSNPQVHSTTSGYTPAIDSLGNVIVTGYCTGVIDGLSTLATGNAFVRKLNSEGSQRLWTTLAIPVSTFYGNFISVLVSPSFRDVQVAGDNTVFVQTNLINSFLAGYISLSASPEKYSPSGVRVAQGPAGGIPNAIAVNGNAVFSLIDRLSFGGIPRPDVYNVFVSKTDLNLNPQ